MSGSVADRRSASVPAADAVGLIAARAHAARPRAGATRVVGIDGRSGAGKSTLAARLADALDAPTVQLETLYEGWDGLEVGIDVLAAEVLAPLARGSVARIPRYDWLSDRWQDEGAVLAPPPLLVVEGVGAGARRVARYLSVLVWLELPDGLRKERALARDGDTFRPYWDRWAAQEDALLARECTRERADVVVDTLR